MCTVTLLPQQNNNFTLTSNRDEHPERETLFPEKYIENGVEMLFPKDKFAGGTWIGVSDKKRMVCVLNGAFKNHKKKNNYKKSRGVLAREILKTDNFLEFITNFNFKGIEPFTIIIVDWNSSKNNYFELTWDEKTKHFNKLKNEPKIWSSSTLYEDDIKEIRKEWFQEWLETSEITSENILKFHHLEKGDKTQTILMKRPNCETVSITQVKKTASKVKMMYEDVIYKKISEIKF